MARYFHSIFCVFTAVSFWAIPAWLACPVSGPACPQSSAIGRCFLFLEYDPHQALVRKLPPLHHEFHLKSSSLLPVPCFTGKVKCWLLWVVIAQRHSGWSHFLCFLKFPPAWLWAVQDKDGLHSFCCSWCLAQSMTPKSCSRLSEIINHFALLIVSQFQCYYLEIHILSGNEAIKKKKIILAML